MSRARNIKPGFFKNDALADCQPLARLLFAGLWCEADRAGRLEDRPKRIKAECLPYDDCDVDALLGELADHGFIIRYKVDEHTYIQILAFDKHQNPHCKEQASTIPAPCMHGANTEQAGLIPDSLNLIPDSKHESPNGDSSASADADAPTKSDPIPYKAIIDGYNQELTNLGKARELTPKRRSLIRSAWQASPDRRSLDFWAAYWAECQADEFLNGTGPYREPHANWRPNFDYLLRADVVTRTFERAMDRLERAE